MTVREGRYGKFLGCTNYGVTGCRYTFTLPGKESDN
ncbi:MAG: hypothetical protein IKD69_13440 [Solobacterium sp.]|nr:hypothetical protein [Solobacterium sp.]